MSGRTCVCTYGELADTRCPVHGLYDEIRFPPMDRHKRGETAAEAQKRLYLSQVSDRARVEAAGFPWPIRACPPRDGCSQR